VSETSGDGRKRATRDDFRNLLKSDFVEIDVPGVGLLKLRNLSWAEEIQIESKNLDGDGKADPMYLFADRLIAMAEDEDGAMFGEIDREWISKLPYSVASRLMAAMRMHNDGAGLKQEEIKKK